MGDQKQIFWICDLASSCFGGITAKGINALRGFDISANGTFLFRLVNFIIAAENFSSRSDNMRRMSPLIGMYCILTNNEIYYPCNLNQNAIAKKKKLGQHFQIRLPLSSMKTMQPESNIDRRLGPVEKFFWLIDKQSPINLLIHAVVRGNFSKNTLQVALKSIQVKHPLLRARIVREGRSQARFACNGVPEIPLRVLEAPRLEWERLAEQELNACFESEKGPLARATLIQHTPGLSTILLTLHHCIADGISGAYLMRDLLQATSWYEEREDPVLSRLSARRELEAYLPPWASGLRGRWRYLQYWRRVLTPIARYGRPMNLSIEKFLLSGKRAHFIARILEPEVVRELSKRAKLEKTTVHGALGSAIILALSKVVNTNKESLYLVGSPVNLRSRLHPPIEDDVGLFVTMGISSGLAGKETEFWSLAREFRGSLFQCVKKGYPFVFLYQQKDLNIISSLVGLGPRGRYAYGHFARKVNPGAWGLSNIGKVQIEPHQGPFTIESLGFSTTGSVWFRFASFAATLKERMTWNFVSMAPMHTREHTERVADLAIKTLTESI